jgi:Flp pilus assembly protein TadG
MCLAFLLSLSIHSGRFSLADTMSAKPLFWNYLDRLGPFLTRKTLRSNTGGQAIVEFTLVFLLLLVVAWIPTDFGLAFFTGQLALNASREGARIAAASADTDANPKDTIHTINQADIVTETCKRLSSALLGDPGASNCAPYSNARVDVTGPVGTQCAQTVTVTVTGSYNFFFYQLLNLLVGADIQPLTIARTTTMRYEHQDLCAAGT